MDQAALSPNTPAGVTFPCGDRELELVFRALGGNYAFYEQQAVADLYDKGDRAIQYAMNFFAPMVCDAETAPCLQAAIDIAQKIMDEGRERLAGRFVLCDLPAWMKMPENAQLLDDDALRCAIVNHWFHAALDAQGQGNAEVIIVRRTDDGTQKVRRIGIREVKPLVAES